MFSTFSFRILCRHRFLLSRYINTTKNRQEVSVQTSRLRNATIMVFDPPEKDKIVGLGECIKHRKL